MFVSVPGQSGRAPGNKQIRRNKARGTSTHAVSFPAALDPFFFFLGGCSDGGLELVEFLVSLGRTARVRRHPPFKTPDYSGVLRRTDRVFLVLGFSCA